MTHATTQGGDAADATLAISSAVTLAATGDTSGAGDDGDKGGAGDVKKGADDKGASDGGDKGAKTRPADLPEEFWDKDKGEIKTEALIKSQKDLRQKISKGLKEPPPETPDGYKFTPAEGITLAETDPGLKLARSVAHKSGLSQDAFNTFVNNFMKDAPAMLAELDKGEQLTPEQIETRQKEANKAELVKLDKDPVKAQKVVDTVVQFFKGKVDQGSLDQGDYKALMRMGGDAAGIRALSKIMSVVYNEPAIPTDGASDDGGYSIDQYYKDVQDPRYESDANFRKQAKAKLAKITGDEAGGNAPRGFGMPASSQFDPARRATSIAARKA